MNLLEIFDYTAQSVLKDRPLNMEVYRSERVLTQDEIIWRLLDEAQDDAVSDSHCFIDRVTPDVALYPLTAGQNFVALNPLVLSVHDCPIIEYKDCSIVLQRASPRTLWSRSDCRTPRCFTVEQLNGTTKQICLDAEVQEHGAQLRTLVARKALVRFVGPAIETESETLERLALQCELPAQYHDRMTDYVMIRTMSHRDVDKQAARDRKAAGERWIQTKLDLRADAYRLHSADDLVYANPWI